MTASKYLCVVIAIVVILSGLVVGFNRVIDPFWFYRDISWQGINAIKPKFKNYERHVKPALVQREQPATLIFGSSFSEIGFDPLHPALRSFGKSYNFGQAGAPWDMVYCDLQFAISHDKGLRQIILGIQPEDMVQKDCRMQIAKMEDSEERAFLFSYDAFEASINTVLEQHDGKPTHTAEGLYFYTRGLPGTASRFREVFSIHMPCDIQQIDTAEIAEQPTHRAKLVLGGLGEIMRKAIAHGITIKLVVYPRHVLSFEQEYQCGLRQSRWGQLAEIVSFVQEETNNQVEVWDFEGYHAITTESISEAPGHYWQDPAHFNYEFGNIMLDEIFGIQPPKFGMRLTLKNLPVRARDEIKARAVYLHEHPELLQQLENLLPKNGD